MKKLIKLMLIILSLCVLGFANVIAAENVIYIRTADDFNNIYKNTNAKYKLVGDIDFQNKPIKTVDTFSGSIDGGGFMLRNFNITAKGDAAIFGKLAYTSRISNLNIENANIISSGSAAILANHLYGIVEDVNIVSGSVESNSSVGYVGSIASFTYDNAIIKNCTTYATVSGVNVGGLAGKNINSRAENSYVAGKIVPITSSIGKVGAVFAETSINRDSKPNNRSNNVFWNINSTGRNNASSKVVYDNISNSISADIYAMDSLIGIELPDTISLYKDERELLRPTTYPANFSLHYNISSSDRSVVDISGDYILAKSKGKATINIFIKSASFEFEHMVNVTVSNIGDIQDNISSNNAYLSKLNVVGHDIKPSFSPNTYTYDLDIDGSVNNLDVNATAQNSYDDIRITGNKNLIQGQNIISVIVSNSNLNSRTYKIRVNKKPKDNILDDTGTSNTEDDILVSGIVIGNWSVVDTTQNIIQNTEEQIKIGVNKLIEDSKSYIGNVKTELIIKSNIPYNSKNFTHKIPKDSINYITQNINSALVLQNDIITISLEKDLLNYINNNISKYLEIAVVKPDHNNIANSLKAKFSDGNIYDIEIRFDGEVMGKLPTSAQIRLPYRAKSRDNDNNVVMYSLANNGSYQVLDRCVYTKSEAMMKFNINGSSRVAVATNLQPFIDVSGWYYEDVEFLYARDIINGKTDIKFAPNDNLTRAEISKLLYSIPSGIPNNAAHISKYSDVRMNDWFYKYVAWGVENTIFSNVSGSLFSPLQNVTREEMAFYLVKYLNYIGFDTKTKVDSAGSFVDESSISPYARDSVEILRQLGIIKGDNNSKFNPKSNITRSEIAALLARFIKII